MEAAENNLASTPASSSNTNTCPWGAKVTSKPTSFQEVMSEELAEQLDTDEVRKLAQEFPTDFPSSQAESSVSQSPVTGAQNDVSLEVEDFALEESRHPQDTSDDLLMAQMLQNEFDREYDSVVKKEENQLNKNSKVSISFENYRRTTPHEDEPEVLGSDEEQYWDEDQYIKEPEPTFKRGVSGKGENMITKHDATITGRRNIEKLVENLPPETDVGNSEGMDIKLSNKVYNKLKVHGMAEEKKKNRLHEKKEHSTADLAFDERTRIILYKLVNADILQGVHGTISTGKEAAVLHAMGGDADLENIEKIPDEVAIKVFRTTLTEFKNRSEYVKGDARYFKDEFKKMNPRKVMALWAQKEKDNLMRLQRFGLPVPRVITIRKHVLLMSFIGNNQIAAPKLKDARLKLADYERAYEQVKNDMKCMYQKCLLVHADLSEYNMLWHDNKIFFIDVGQAVDTVHPHAHEFLLRDCRNVTDFFTKAGVADVGDEYALFRFVTNLELKGTGKDFLMQIQGYEKNEEKLRTGTSTKDFPFDYFFDLAAKSKELEDSGSD